jgi:adenine-specific DNA glycosylase
MADYVVPSIDGGIIGLIERYNAKQEGVGIEDEVVEGLRRDLLSWYYTNRRFLPWRGDKKAKDGVDFDLIMQSMEFPNPYGTWVR